jgi:hypothetical protein
MSWNGLDQTLGLSAWGGDRVRQPPNDINEHGR